MNKRQRKKQAKLQASLGIENSTAGPIRVRHKRNREKPHKVSKFNDALTQYLKQYRDQLKDIESKYSTKVDNYIQEEIAKKALAQQQTMNYPSIEPVDYIQGLRNIGLNVARSEIRVVPNLTNVAMYVSSWKARFDTYMSDMPDNFIESSFGERAYADFGEEIREFYVEYQERPELLMDFKSSLVDYIKKQRDEYLAEGANIVFGK